MIDWLIEHEPKFLKREPWETILVVILTGLLLLAIPGCYFLFLWFESWWPDIYEWIPRLVG